MKSRFLALAAALLCHVSSAFAAPAWVDWTSTTTGTMGTNAVTLTGPTLWLDNGTTYYVNSATTPATYGGLAPFDVIATQYASQFILTFSQPVQDLYMALVSVGSPTIPVTYQFYNEFDVVSFGPNYWGYGGYTLDGTTLTGTEFNGILRLHGNFGPNAPLVFDVLNPEGWHGFNVAAIPEPETYAMMLAGLGIVGAMARRRRN